MPPTARHATQVAARAMSSAAEGRRGVTYAHQSSLPKLPVPPLDHTLQVSACESGQPGACNCAEPPSWPVIAPAQRRGARVWVAKQAFNISVNVLRRLCVASFLCLTGF